MPRLADRIDQGQEGFTPSDDRNTLFDELFSDSESIPEQDERCPKRRRIGLGHISVSEIAYPRSAYEGYISPHAESAEADALLDLEAAFKHVHATDEEQPEYTIFDLDDFNIYLPHSSLRHKGELVTLDRLQNKMGCSEFLFSGVLSCGGAERYVVGVAFMTLTLEGYADADAFRMSGRLCIQSKEGEKRNVWYRLGRPSREYKRFYDPFVWLATFAKQFVDYLLETPQVNLNNFRRRFRAWLNTRYVDSKYYASWLDECRNMNDFRTTVSANVGFLLKEAHSIDHKLRRHPIWKEIWPWDLTAVPHQPERESLTVVTPFVYDCFRRMYFRDHLQMRIVTDQAVLTRTAARKHALRLSPFNALGYSKASMPWMTPPVLEVKPGDVVTVTVDAEGAWKGSSGIAHAYVQRVRRLLVRTVLDIIWLYEPSDTTLTKAYYPFPNELFMSDNCECGSAAIDLECVIGKIDISWTPHHPELVTGPFVRQTYRTNPKDNMYDFVTLRQSHFACECTERISDFEDCRRKYQIGDTVLVRQRSKELCEDILEPAQVIDFDLDRDRVVLRRFGRKTRFDIEAKPNELVLTEEIYEKAPGKVIRRCYVRVFQSSTVDTGLPAPYNRNGAGDYYFVRDQAGSEALGPDTHSDDGLPPLEQGPDLAGVRCVDKLIGMGLFCGGGKFDRGMAEGGAVHFKYAVDYAKTAIHTYSANVDEDDDVKLFFGSVDDYLARAMQGQQHELVAQPGHVDFICGGSPCPGFSDLQQDKGSFESLRNASKVASFLSFVDFYAPGYCMLENVLSMTKDIGPSKTDNVFAQILAALVGLGYQVQQVLMDAGALGSAENRARVIIVASAPGLEPFLRPPITHAYPCFRWKALGKTSNGLSFGERQDLVTPFQNVSASAATSDLPDVGDSQPQLCPAFPDHRTPSEECENNRTRIASIPKRPRGMGLAQTARQGLLKGEPLEFFRTIERNCPRGARTYSRIVPNEQFPTITTASRPRCYQTGRTLHWDQDRLMTVMEYRRAQGYLDHEVILGTLGEQVRIIGNGVNRYVGLALGLMLRESWTSSDMGVRDEVQCLTSRVLPGEYVSDSGYDEQASATSEGAGSMGKEQTPTEETSTTRAGNMLSTPVLDPVDEEDGENIIVSSASLEEVNVSDWTEATDNAYVLV